MTNEGIVTITIGPDYFKRNARKDYSNPLEFVWIREALQNSIDAGATEVNITLENGLLSLSDNGCGMDKDTILNKLLVLGGTKKADGAVGGFGKAKEILFFCWDKWSIHTAMEGGTGLYIDRDHLGKKPVSEMELGYTGTEITIQYAEGSDDAYEEIWIDAIKGYVETISTDATIRLNGNELNTLKLKGKRKDNDWCEIIIDEKSDNAGQMFIRVHGVTMFMRRLNNVKALIIIELNGESVDFLSGNRDTLVYPYRNKLDDLINEFMIDPLTAVKVPIPPKIEAYAGLDIMEKLRNMFNDVPGLMAEVSNAVARHTVGGITNFAKLDKDLDGRIGNDNPELKGVVRQLIAEEHESVGPMGYKFYVKRDGAKKPNLKIESKKVQTVLHYWTSMVMRMEEQYPTYEKLGVGLTFGDDVNGEVINVQGRKILLINPNIIESTSSKIALGVEIFGLAAHEFAHLTEPYHDEHFASRMTKIQRGLGINWNDWYQLFIDTKKEILEAF